MNPWLEIPLEDYEAHMSMASVAQAQYLAQVLEGRVRELCPASVAVIGCAGGNGFQLLSPGQVKRVVGIDINPHFIDTARKRYADRFQTLELLCGDVVTMGDRLEPVDFVFAGLLFEYVDCAGGLASIVKLLRAGGHLSVVLQLPAGAMPAVSPTPYGSLFRLEESFRFVVPGEFESAAGSAGLRLLRRSCRTLDSGKSFQEYLFRAPSPQQQ